MKKFVAVLALLICSVLHAETWPLATVRGAVPISGRHVAVQFVNGNAFAGLAECFSVDSVAATLAYDDAPQPGPTQQGQVPRSDQVRSTYRTTWQCADGTTQEVVTPCATFREPLDCAHAHRAGVDAMKIVFPPIVPRQ